MRQPEVASKVTAEHLSRNAYLYVRQSTLRQVVENTESTQRQYALRQRAIALGWPEQQVVVIDKDLGQSAASAADRAGFGELVAEVGMGRAGIVLGLEVSRLARNNTDWHRLLEICGLFNTLILDEDGIYDPAHFNDRLLLGLKGTMSEAELHILRARLRGGILNKARRGELRMKLPIGFVYDAADRVILDPDKRVQESVRLLFATFARTGAGCATVKHFRKHGLEFPLRPSSGAHKDEVVWQQPGLWRVLSILHNPRYAGAFVYGRRRTVTMPDGRTRSVRLDRDDWTVLRLDAHPGYISWSDYERNQQQIEKTAKAFGQDRRHGPPREGPALLQGLAVCGICGVRMSVRYRRRNDRLLPTYTCCTRTMEYQEPPCQSLHGEAIDAAIGHLLVELMKPMALELSMAVHDEIQQRLDEADRLRRMHVDSAQYEVDLARQRYMQVDPCRRLVADSLEANWNEKLRALEAAREEYERGRKADRARLDDEQRKRILELTNDFPALWADPRSSHLERKRMTALLIEDVTLRRRGDTVDIGVRFRGGRTQRLEIPAPIRECDRRRTAAETVAQIDALLDEGRTDSQIAAALNTQGSKTGAGDAFTVASVRWVKQAARLRSVKQRLRDQGMLTCSEIADQLGIGRTAVMDRLRRGQLRARRTNDNGHWLFRPLDRQPDTGSDLRSEACTDAAAADGNSHAKGAV